MTTPEMLAALEKIGCNTNDAVARMLGNADMYADLMRKYAASLRVPELGRLLGAQKYTEAFDCVHDIKGASGELSLTPLYASACRLTEILRAGGREGLEAEYAKISAAYKAILEILEEDKK